MINQLSKLIWALQSKKYHKTIKNLTKKSIESIYHNQLIPKIASLLKKNRTNDSILDLGCGDGYLSNQLTKIGFSVDAVDYSPTAISIAKKTYSQPNFYTLNAEKIYKLNKKYKVIIACQLMHSLSNGLEITISQIEKNVST